MSLNVLDVSAAELGAVARQLGRQPVEPSPRPDVVVTYVAELTPPSTLVQVEHGRFGWSGDRFWLLRGLGSRRVHVTFEPSTLERAPLHLTSERRGRGLPLLTQILGVIAAHHGAVAVHGSAFLQGGQGVLVTGWSRAGKTEALLAALSKGATAVGDDIVLLDSRTSIFHGVHAPVHLHAWHLAGDERLREQIRRPGLGAVAQQLSGFAARRSTRGPAQSRTGRLVRAALRAGDRMTTASVGLETIVPEHRLRDDAHLDHVVIVHVSSDPEVRLRRGTAHEAAARAQLSIQEERSNLVHAHRQLQYAFPGARWPALDDVDELERSLLEQAFDAAAVWDLVHPHPLPISALTPALDAITAR